MTSEHHVKLWRRDMVRIRDILDLMAPHPAPECDRWRELVRTSVEGGIRQDAEWQSIGIDPVPPLPTDDADDPDTEVYGEPVGTGGVIDWGETQPWPV